MTNRKVQNLLTTNHQGKPGISSFQIMGNDEKKVCVVRGTFSESDLLEIVRQMHDDKLKHSKFYTETDRWY